MTTYLNIWLARDGQPDLAISEVHDVLLANLIHTYEFELQSSVTEATVVVTITSHAPSHEVLVNVAKMLDQDCIAAFDGEVGALLGPNAEAWGPFDLSQFLFPKAQQEFTVEAQGRADRVRVSWGDETFRYWFFAEFTGDQITKVSKVLAARPTILRTSKAYRGSTDYLDAGAPAFAHIVLNATRHIRERKLITQAVKARDERLAAQEAARIAENAKRVRSALDTAFGEYEAIAGGLGLHGMRGYQREAIISVSNLDDAFLHRVAAILGCD